MTPKMHVRALPTPRAEEAAFCGSEATPPGRSRPCRSASPPTPLEPQRRDARLGRARRRLWFPPTEGPPLAWQRHPGPPSAAKRAQRRCGSGGSSHAPRGVAPAPRRLPASPLPWKSDDRVSGRARRASAQAIAWRRSSPNRLAPLPPFPEPRREDGSTSLRGSGRARRDRLTCRPGRRTLGVHRERPEVGARQPGIGQPRCQPASVGGCGRGRKSAATKSPRRARRASHRTGGLSCVAERPRRPARLP